MKKHLTTIITFTLISIGLIFITISSQSEASNLFNDQLHFIKRQIFWVVIGTLLYIFFSNLHIKRYQKYIPSLYLLSVGALILVLLPPLSQKILGARRWLEIGDVTIQPSEIFKLSSILFFSQLFSQSQYRNLKTFLIYLVPPLLLIILQPNLSTAIITVLIITSLYYLSGAEIVPLFLLSFLITTVSFILIITSGYRLTRLQALLNQTPITSYHSNQITLAISSGGIFGKGLANSEQKYRYLPKIPTDSILAIIGEETGFLGITVIICLYLYLIIHIFTFTYRLTNQFDILLATGVGCWLAYQSLVNISSLATLIPLTGIPLPLISYGGSSVTSILAALGIFHNLEQHQSSKYEQTK